MASIIAMADDALPSETGGILVGHYTHRNISGARDAVVTDVIGPGPRSTSTTVSFEPDSRWQAEELARIYELRDRRVVYLGDWHTHPGGTSTPSATDRRTLVSIARHAPARCPQPIMAILGNAGKDRKWSLRALGVHNAEWGRVRFEDVLCKLYPG